MIQLRTALNEARAALGLPPAVYFESGLDTGFFIRAAHITDIRNGLK